VTDRFVCTTSDPTPADITTPSPGLTALIWKSTVDWPACVRTVAGTWTAALELETFTSAVLPPSTLRSVSRHVAGVPDVTVLDVQDNFETDCAAEIAMDAVEFFPLNAAVNTAVPEADESASAAKLALVLP